MIYKKLKEKLPYLIKLSTTSIFFSFPFTTLPRVINISSLYNIKNTTLFTLLLISMLAFTQTEESERFNVKGGAKLITTWTSISPKNAIGTLTCGDKIKILKSPASTSIDILAVHNNKYHILAQIDDESTSQFIADSTLNNISNNIVIKVYEYDFDADGEREIIIVHSPEFSVIKIQVFRYSGGLSQLVGSFDGQFEIILDKDTIYLPYGSQGLGDEFIYRDGGFYELTPINQNKKNK